MIHPVLRHLSKTDTQAVQVLPPFFAEAGGAHNAVMPGEEWSELLRGAWRIYIEYLRTPEGSRVELTPAHGLATAYVVTKPDRNLLKKASVAAGDGSPLDSVSSASESRTEKILVAQRRSP